MQLKNWFIFDMIGALLGSIAGIFLAFLISDFTEISIAWLRICGIISFCYFMFDLVLIIKNRISFQFLHQLAIMNFCYALLILVLLLLFIHQINIWGVFFYIGEILLVVLLALGELNYLKKNNYFAN